MKHRLPKGFSLVELLTVVGVIGFLLTIGIFSFRVIENRVALGTATEEVLNALRVAQERSLSSQDGIQHGVHFDATQYVLFGGSWAAPTYQKVYTLPNRVQISQGVGTELVFERLNGKTTVAEIRVAIGGSEKAISVSNSGRISL
jgi:prepilin-type N-terminal cleavage/methylation domain-containing protein